MSCHNIYVCLFIQTADQMHLCMFVCSLFMYMFATNLAEITKPILTKHSALD